MIGKPHWYTTPNEVPRSPWWYPPGSDERKRELRRRWVQEFGHDKCVYCNVTLSFSAHSARQRGTKGYVPDPLEAQRDHNIPGSRGGGGGANVVPACRTCNTRKGAKTGAEFRAVLAGQKA